jgi:hypothetical protein
MNPDPTTLETPQSRHNRLDLTKTIKLIDWIREHEAAAMEQPDTKLASQAQLELGFKITVPNFVSTREGLGIQKARPPEPPTEMEALTARVAALEVELQLLKYTSKQEQKTVPEPSLFSGEFLRSHDHE